MQITNRFTIAIQMLITIDKYIFDQVITSKFLAEKANIHPSAVRQVMSMLRNNGIIITKQGRAGVQIARDTKDISLLDIYKAVEAIDHGRLFNIHENNATDGFNLVMEDTLLEAQSKLDEYLENTSLYMLITRVNEANNRL